MTISDLRKLIESLPDELEVKLGDKDYSESEERPQQNIYDVESHSFVYSVGVHSDMAKNFQALVLWIN